jgi:hypothetical protein
MNNRWLHNPIAHADAQERLYDQMERYEGLRPTLAEAPWQGTAQVGDPFVVKACDRPEYQRIGEFRGFNCGFVVLRFGPLAIQTFPACDVAPASATRAEALAADQGRSQSSCVNPRKQTV